MPGRNYALKMHQIKVAVSLYRCGMSRRVVAAHFGVTDMAVRNAFKLVGEPMRDRAYAAVLAISKDPQKHLRNP